MGYSASALTFLGVKINENIVEDKYSKNKRGCEHKTDDKFCRVCGKQTWIAEYGVVPNTINGFKLRICKSTYFLGIELGETRFGHSIVNSKMVSDKEITDVKNNIMITLRKNFEKGADDIIKSFSLYTILDESY